MNPNDPPLEILKGTVEHIVYRNEANGYTVLELDAGDVLTTVVGELLGIEPGEIVTFTGNYTTHPTYGQQFRAQICERELPSTAAAILKYLSSGAIKGIGPRTAKHIVEMFGDNALTIIEKQPERLAEIRGISPKKAAEIAENYQQIFGIRSVMLELSRYEIDPAAAIRAWRMWGSMAVEILRSDPYQLCNEAIGVPFPQADAIAMQMQLSTDAPIRLKAGMIHVLSHNLLNGHTCLPQDKLLQTAAGLLDVELFLLEDVLEVALEEGSLCSDTMNRRRFVYLPEYYNAETYIAGRIDTMLRLTPPDTTASFTHEIDALEAELGLHYAAQQRRAINMALANNIFILTGGPGTGKTTTLNAILTILEQEGDRVVLAAPTGRAAKRMSEVTGREAKTIHRLLEVNFRDHTNRITFKHNEKNPLRVDTIILDEVSMVDTLLLHHLMRAMKLSCRLILVGDPDQLPSVGAGNILKDLIDSERVPLVHLDEIFRQAQQSSIVSNAHNIMRGEAPDLAVRDSDFFFLRANSYEAIAKTVCDLCAERLPRAYGYSPISDIQVIAPSRVGALGTIELNRLLQARLNPSQPDRTEQKFGGLILREKDKVMQVRNNYDIIWKREDGDEGTGIFNGDIGIIEMIDRPSQSILIRFDDRIAEYSFAMVNELELAYAVTVHKSQGSEFEAVIIPLMNYHPKLYYRNILYTGVTRARKILILLGQPETIQRMVNNHRKILRYTGLCPLLVGAMEAEPESL